MFERIRLPLIVATMLLFAYGAFTFWQGKTAVDAERDRLRLRDITLDQFGADPPVEGASYRISGAAGAMIFGQSKSRTGTDGTHSGDVLDVYYPLVDANSVPDPFVPGSTRNSLPPSSIVVLSEEPDRLDFQSRLLRMQRERQDTYVRWFQQVRKDAFPTDAVQGVLRKPNAEEKLHLQSGRHHLDDTFWILDEDAESTTKVHPKVTIGLSIMMGLPTAWIFLLLLTGKLAPPDEDILPAKTTDAPSNTLRPADLPADNTEVMPAMSEADSSGDHRRR